MRKCEIVLVLGCLVCGAALAAVVDVTGVGLQKKSVAVNVQDPEYARTLRRNLELSGLFTVQPQGMITVSGTPGGEITALGDGRSLKLALPVTDALSKRMAARRFADEMCKAFENQSGFARDRIAFVKRNGANNGDIGVTYPDGQDVKLLTANRSASVGPRWADPGHILYTGYGNGKPEIWELDALSGAKHVRWSFNGLSTGAVISPDGRRAAIILSFQGNPELYVIDLASKRWTRLTETPSASEGQPAWSPDGGAIVYVSNEARHPRLYVLDLASGRRRRITSNGNQNVDPDWGPDGRIAYVQDRQLAVYDPKTGKSTVLPRGGGWEHPSWARDGRHLVASQGRTLYLVDTLEGGDDPKALFRADGNWINPSWSR